MARKGLDDQILFLVARFPEGASLEEILIGLSPAPSRRTLQRHLSILVKAGQLFASGNTRSRRYRLANRFTLEEAPSLVPLSQEGLQVEWAVSQPPQMRKAARYHRKFLEEYRPNVTSYLSEDLKKKLLSLGNSNQEYPAGTYAKKIFRRLLIDLSWNSSRLEGNTYSLLETERLLEEGKAAKGKGLKDTQMILNHKAAIEFLVDSAEEIGINRYTLLNLHTLLSDNLLSDSASCGRLRTIPVGIAKSVYTPPDIPQVIEECFYLLIEKAQKIEDPFEQAFFLMVQLPYLQPFDDVNKRTSRLAANIPLIRKNLCPLSFIDVPEQTYINGLLGIYELNRIELLRDLFVWAYERSSALYATTRKTLGEPDPFRFQYRNAIQQAVQEVVRSSMDKVRAVKAIQKFASSAIPEQDRSRFVEMVERELQSLHEGNFARYRLRPAEFERWKEGWS